MCIRDSLVILRDDFIDRRNMKVQKFAVLRDLCSVQIVSAGAVLVTVFTLEPVSYTHLDVYKRQVSFTLKPSEGRRLAAAECLATDAGHTFAETAAFRFDPKENRIACELPEHSFYLFRIAQR